MQDGRKAVWSIPYVFEIDQLWQSGFFCGIFSKFKTEFYCLSFF